MGKPADRVGFDSRSKAVYMDDETGKSYVKVVKCSVCKALVEVEDRATHEEVLHPEDPIDMGGSE